MKPYYERGGVQLFHGDARDVLPTLSERGHVIFDPPYSEHTHSKSRAGARRGIERNSAGKVTAGAFSRAVDFNFAHLSSRDRSMFATHAARLATRWALVFSDTEGATWWRLALEARGLSYVRTAFWRKLAGSPQFTGDRPGVACEAITICHPKGRKQWNGGGKAGFYEFPVVQPWAGTEPRLHTTQKPERLMLALIDDFTDPGELVYDFTAGSCTTGIACLRGAGGPRRFVGIEREEKWLEAGARRIDAELDGCTYHAAKAGQIGLFGGAR